MMKKRGFQIAIDGPAGAGKSTIAKMTAKKLDLIYVDTGAMYRAAALGMLREGVDPDREASVSAALKNITVTIRYTNGEQKVVLNGMDVSDEIRTEQVSRAASAISVYPAVRMHLRDLQQNLAAENNIVMDGRDIGTCILPEADVKIFLTASPHVRAKRRYRELAQKGGTYDLEKIEKDIIERDQRDMNREIAPLRQAEDAIYLDSSDMTPVQVTDAIIGVAKEHGWKAG